MIQAGEKVTVGRPFEGARVETGLHEVTFDHTVTTVTLPNGAGTTTGAFASEGLARLR